MKTNYKIVVKHLRNENIYIDKKEVLRYLQYKSKVIDEETNRLLDECIVELKDLSELKYIYRIFDISKEVINNNTSINFEDEIIIESKDLTKLFQNCDKVVILATSLGLAVEKRIRYYSLSSLSKGIIFDACATAYIEALCDYVEGKIKTIAKKEGVGITFRYSPGYGDVSISHQKDLVNSLNATKLIGLTVSESSILIPRKSVTAFVGFDKAMKAAVSHDSTDNFEKSKKEKNSCPTCKLYADCNYRKEGGKPCDK